MADHLYRYLTSQTWSSEKLELWVGHLLFGYCFSSPRIPEDHVLGCPFSLWAWGDPPAKEVSGLGSWLLGRIHFHQLQLAHETHKLPENWLQWPDEMHLAPTWYLIPVSTAPYNTQWCCEIWPKLRTMPSGVLATPLKREFNILATALHPLERMVQVSAKALEPDWLCCGVAWDKSLNLSMPQFPHQ